MKNTTNLRWILAGIAFIAVSLPLILQVVPPNRWYGFRLKKTLSDETIWYAANRIAGYDLLIAGGVVLATAIITALLARSRPGFAVEGINLGVFWVSLSVAVGHSFWALSRM